MKQWFLNQNRKMLNWGIKETWIFAIVLAIVAVSGFGIYQNVLNHPIGSVAENKNIVPAIGPDNTYTATEEFCRDKNTDVRPLIIPDSTGYELIRVKDGKTESITVVFSIDAKSGALIPSYAKYDNDSNDPIPAAIDSDAAKCLQDKVKVK